MQKKIIALAVAGLVSGVAFAQSNVTISGRLDSGFSSWSGDGGYNTVSPAPGAPKGKSEKYTGVHSNGYTTSRLTFEGQEALGNGLKAVFKMESEVGVDDTVAAGWNNRETYVGMDGGFGRFQIGKQSSLSDKWYGGKVEEAGNLSATNLINKSGSFARGVYANSIAYYAPTMSGLTLGAYVAFKDEGGSYTLNTAACNPAPGADNVAKCGKTSDERSTLYQIGVNYANGPFDAMFTVGFQKHDIYKSQREYSMSASYNFGPAKVFGGYERYINVDRPMITDHPGDINPATGLLYANSALRYNSIASTGAGNRKDSNASYSLGVAVPFGKNTVALSYASTRNDVNNTDNDAYSLSYKYDFSKRTFLYAAYMHIDNEKYAVATPNARYRAASGSRYYGSDYSGVSIGLAHYF